MTILHDNLYTKRAVATCRGRNRYLSRAMSVKWVPPWPKERRPRKKHETMKKRPNSTTCWGTLLATLVPWNNRRKPPRLRLKSHLKSHLKPQHQAALRPVHLQVRPAALRPVLLRVLPAAHPQVLLRVRPAAHPAVLPPALRPVHPQALPTPPLPRLKPKSKPSPRPRPLLLNKPTPRPLPQRSPKR